ncbi:MAG: hypothetical protein IT357_16425 [Gemmatimonadaceae bacterium]|nr:hypothetical protein [Gemmatimonadaceae bacterium]
MLVSLALFQTIAAPTALPLRALGDHGPERRTAWLAVSERGDLAFTTGFSADETLVTLVDSTGALLARVGRKGDGPGEFRAPLRLMFRDSTLFVFGDARLSAFTRRGKHLWTRAMPPTDLPMAIHGDSVDAFSSPDLTATLGITRLSLTTMRGREIIAPRVEPLHALTRSAQAPARTVIPGYVRTDDGFIVGNGGRYELVKFDASGVVRERFGRSLPSRKLSGAALEAEVQQRVARARRPFVGPDNVKRELPVDVARIRREAAAPWAHFSGRNGGLQRDARGRIIAIVPQGDSVGLDLFDRSRFIGRAAVACAGHPIMAASSGRFLALLCDLPPTADREVGVRLFRW